MPISKIEIYQDVLGAMQDLKEHEITIREYNSKIGTELYEQSEYDAAFRKGYEKCCDENHILYGEDKDRFLKETGLDKFEED